MFRIYGERNSGTNYLTHLIEKNFQTRVINHDNIGHISKTNVNLIDDWKHEIPNPKPHPKTIDIIIIRKLDTWLISFFNTQWHLIYEPHFQKFLTQPLKPISYHTPKQNRKPETLQINKHTNYIVNYTDKDKTIFQLRYYKWKAYLNYFKNNSNCVLVQLEYIQNPKNCQTFIQNLNKSYKILNWEKFKFENIHLYKGLLKSKPKKQIVNLEDYSQIISKYQISQIEKEINTLTFIIK